MLFSLMIKLKLQKKGLLPKGSTLPIARFSGGWRDG